MKINQRKWDYFLSVSMSHIMFLFVNLLQLPSSSMGGPCIIWVFFFHFEVRIIRQLKDVQFATYGWFICTIQSR
jgi:hypothetical protein